jgi:hypothetical protein
MADDHPRIAEALDRIRSLLVPGELLEAWAVQRRVFALTHRRVLVAATDGRLLVMERGLVAGYRLHDLRWQDLVDAKIEVGILGADVHVTHSTAGDLTMGNPPQKQLSLRGLRKLQAQAVYRTCQSHEQAWREKRRIREIEELRAKSGGVVLGGALGAVGAASAGEGGDPTVRLERAKDMRVKGLISDAEYEAIKAKIVAGL